MAVIFQFELCHAEHRHSCAHGTANATCDRAKGHPPGQCQAWCALCLVDVIAERSKLRSMRRPPEEKEEPGGDR